MKDRLLILVVGMVASFAASAQELRCTQLFMNASEKRICATPSLMELDAQMGRLARRVESSMDDYRGTQRAFRSALKACDGATDCLEKTYQDRIAVLEGAAASLPPPSDEQQSEWAEGDAKAQAKRDAQAAKRDEIAAELEPAPSAEQAPANQETDEKQEQQTQTDAPSVDAQVPDPSEVAYAIPTPAPPEPPKSEPAPAWMSWVFGGFVVLLILGAIVSFCQWVARVVRRCPNCGKWWAGHVVDAAESAYTDYETKTFTDRHLDKNYNLRGTTKRQRQVRVRVVDRIEQLVCKYCRHPWRLRSQTRSS